MNVLLSQVVGWLGYLERPAVVLQLLLVVVVLSSRQVLRRWPVLPLHLRRYPGLLTLSLLTAITLVLVIGRQPYGLVLFALGAFAGWQGLTLLRLALRRVIHPQQLKYLDSRLIRPLYLLLLAVALIRQVDNLEDLSLIQVGKWFGAPIDVGEVCLVILVVYLVAIGSGPPSQGMAWLIQRGIGLTDTSRRALALMIRYGLMGVGIVWALTFIGFNSTAILAVAGGLSVGLGFGIKEVFSNFISGLWLLFEGSVRPGDVLFIDGDPCEVRRLGLRSAVLWRDRDNAELVIPNQTFFTSTTTTYTGSDRMRRSQCLVSAAYRHDPSQVMAVMEQVARASPRVLNHPPPRALLMSYGDSAVNYSLRFWIADPMQNITTCSEVQAAIWTAFKRSGIEIPFPQQVQYRIQGAPGDSEASDQPSTTDC